MYATGNRQELQWARPWKYLRTRSYTDPGVAARPATQAPVGLVVPLYHACRAAAKPLAEYAAASPKANDGG